MDFRDQLLQGAVITLELALSSTVLLFEFWDY